MLVRAENMRLYSAVELSNYIDSISSSYSWISNLYF